PIFGVEVGAVAADVDGERQDQLHGGVEDHAGEPASLVAQERAAGRVGGVLGDTGQAQRLGVDHGLVAGDVVDDHRVPGGGLVQHPPGGAPFGVLGVVQAEGADPLAGGGVPGLFGDGGDQLGDAAHRGVAGVDGGQRLRGGQQVVVRVDEAGEDGAPAGVDHLGAGARGGGGLRLAADGGHSAVGERHRLGAGPGVVHGEDLGVPDEQGGHGKGPPGGSGRRARGARGRVVRWWSGGGRDAGFVAVRRGLAQAGDADQGHGDEQAGDRVDAAGGGEQRGAGERRQAAEEGAGHLVGDGHAGVADPWREHLRQHVRDGAVGGGQDQAHRAQGEEDGGGAPAHGEELGDGEQRDGEQAGGDDAGGAEPVAQPGHHGGGDQFDEGGEGERAQDGLLGDAGLGGGVGLEEGGDDVVAADRDGQDAQAEQHGAPGGAERLAQRGLLGGAGLLAG